MYKLYDVVISKKIIELVPAGTMGTVLLVNKSIRDKISYEVEFIDETGNFIGVFTVLDNDIEMYGNNTSR